MDTFRCCDRFRTVDLAVLAAIACLLALPAPALALDREVVIQFLGPEGSDVTGYHVYVTEEVREFEERLDIGFVSPGADGVTRAPVVVDDALSYRVGMTASNELGESILSNQIHIAAQAPLCESSQCDDDDPCTADSCGAEGCFSAPLPEGTRCDDGFVDTLDDQCIGGVCEGVLLTCRDDLDCDDGNVCNGFEACDGGTVCLEGVPLKCGEPTACSVPRCDVVDGCLTDFLPDGTLCDDGFSDTEGDVCTAGVCQGETPTPVDPTLMVEAVRPGDVSPGLQTISIYGQGFALGAKLSFQNGRGRGIRVKALRLIDGRTLEATVDVSHKGPKRARFWDVVVTLRDGSQAILPDGLQVNP